MSTRIRAAWRVLGYNEAALIVANRKEGHPPHSLAVVWETAVRNLCGGLASRLRPVRPIARPALREGAPSDDRDRGSSEKDDASRKRS